MLAASAVLLLLGYTCMLHPRRAGAVPVDTCTSALLSACSSYTDTVLNCNTCTGKSQHDLRVAGCDSPEVSWWCAQIVVQNATERLSVASTVLSGVSLASIPSASGEDPSQAYRESNLISARQTTATAYDAKRQQLFTGNTCDRRSKYSDCKPGTGLIQKWNIGSQVVVANLTAHNESITDLAYDSTRQLLFSSSDEADEGECCGSVLVWNTAVDPPVVLHTLQSGHSPEFEKCDARGQGATKVSISALSHDETRQLLFASCGNTILQWDFTFMQQGTPPTQKHTMMIGDEFEKRDQILAIAFDPISQWLFSNHLVYDSYDLEPTRVIHRWFTGARVKCTQ